MKYLKQLAILFAFCVAGDGLSMLTGGKLPGNVLGMTLLFICLASGLVRLCHIAQTADFFLQNMAFFFIPACLSIIDTFSMIQSELVAIFAVIAFSTLITAVVTAGTVHLVLRLQGRRGADA